MRSMNSSQRAPKGPRPHVPWTCASPTTPGHSCRGSWSCRPSERRSEEALELAPQNLIDLSHRRRYAEISKTGHALVADAAGYDPREVLQDRVDVESHAV